MVILTVIIVFICILLTAVVLLQKSKGGGLAAGFQSSNQIMGAPKTANFLEKATWTLMGVIALLCICCTLILKHSDAGVSGSAIEAIQNSALAVPEAVADDAAATANAAAAVADGVDGVAAESAAE